ncbi:hypothetical protein AU476_38530 [Cupriavidus sp. UYMSc13B]|nr:hypothetical protein AU476_38530 [Cupriavidus sp. UYMSc13B]
MLGIVNYELQHQRHRYGAGLVRWRGEDKNGRVVEASNAPSTTVTETARKVIVKHNEVIKRLAKR